ncbi:MAG: DNA polymerase I [Pseudomonadales bacterium]|nr:DNA polymerase I [Pseudomonadales bacterium]
MSRKTLSDTPPLVLVDGSSYLFRAFHALPPLSTSSGQPTGAVKGVINMIRSLVKAYPQSPVAVVFDAKGKTFRNELYAGYKAQRPPMPDELRSQIAPIHRIIEAMGLPLIVVDGVEADDVIGTLATQAWQRQMPTLISTGDKDLAQLVNEHVTLLNTMTNETLDVAGVEKKFGLPPARIIDYLALMGDKSDNIPGVPGVGPKTAQKWLQEYDSVENLIAHADRIGGKAGETLRAHIPQLRLSYELATIKLDVPLSFGPQDLGHQAPAQQELLALYREMEFKSWVRELENSGVTAPGQAAGKDEPEAGDPAAYVAPTTVSWQAITTPAQLTACVEGLKSAGAFAFYLQADEQHYKLASLIGLAFSTTPGQAHYIPLGHDLMGVPEQLSHEQVLQALKPLFEDAGIGKIGHDLKPAIHILHNYGIALKGLRFDTMLQSYVLNSVAHRHSLEKLVENYLDEDRPTLDSVLGKGRNKLGFAQLDLAQATDWAAASADYSLRLSRVLDQKLKATGQLVEIYRYFEIALLPVLARMEDNGILLDIKVIGEQSLELAKSLAGLEQAAWHLAGEEFNLGSPQQLQKIFYEKLKFSPSKKTAGGQLSTAEPVLQELALEHELPRVILEYRGLSKLKTTYTDKLPLDVNPATGRIHSNFQQAVAATGRLSSMDPNLQNIPIRSEEGRRIRKAFIAAPGYVLMSADYSQVELRIMAHLSRDEGLLQAFAKGLDVHRATAAEIFTVPLEQVSSEQRRSAKAINFGLIYGMSAFGLANQLGIGRAEAQAWVDRYFERYPGVRQYMDNTRMLANEQGYVETLFGRRLYLPDIRAGNGMLRKAAERTAINAPMQGTAADIIKRAMIDIDQWLKGAGLDVKMVLQVHDELVFEVAEDDLALLSEGVRFRMVSAAALAVPLVVDIGSGPNWDEAH